jgi:hypothetical protein
VPALRSLVRLADALAFGAVEEAVGGGALGDADGHVEGRPGEGAAGAAGEVAVGVVDEAGVDDAVDGAGDGRHGVRLGAVAVAAYSSLGGDVADGVVADGAAGYAGAAAGDEAVHGVVAKVLADVDVGIAAAGEVAFSYSVRAVVSQFTGTSRHSKCNDLGAS